MTVYLDDLSFQGPPPAPDTPTPSPTPPAPPPTSTPAPAPSATTTPRSTAVATPPPAAATEPDVYPYLVNGGFEEARADGTPAGWSKVGGETARSGAAHAEGSYSAAFTSSSESTKWLYETVAVQGGAYYRLDAQVLNPDTVAEAFLRVSWYVSGDSSGQSIASADSADIVAGSASFQGLSIGSVEAPAQARSARVRLMLRPASAARLTVYFDAVAFAATGPPGRAGDAPAGGGAAGANSGPAPASGGQAPAVLGAAAAPGRLANVRAPQAGEAQARQSEGSGFDWPLALALGVPFVTLALAAGLEWRRRRLAAGDGGHL